MAKVLMRRTEIWRVDTEKEAAEIIDQSLVDGGELTKKLTVQASKFSKSALEKIEAAGGKAEVF